MSLQGQFATRSALQELKTNPLGVLGQCALEVKLSNQMVGHNTQRIRLSLGYRPDIPEYHMGDFATNYATGQIDQDSLVYIWCLATPMRDSAAPFRLNAVQRFSIGNSDFWVTDQQSGCSVMILDWGGGQYSMVHLRPHDHAQFNRLSRKVLSLQSLRAPVKDFWLGRDLSRVVRASLAGGGDPLQYILVQSMAYAQSATLRMQVVGVNSGGTWIFFLQKIQRDHHGIPAQLLITQLQWSGWNDTYFYQSYQ